MRQRLLRLLRVSERPDPPPGSGASLATFRASQRYLYLSALKWFPKQLSALAGLLFALVFFGTIELPFFSAEGWIGFLDRLDFFVEIGPWSFSPADLFVFFELLAIAGFAAQLVFTGSTIYLDWQLRWYMVGDEALRIREGLWTVREQTITVANVQKMTIRQGPIQKLFGVADLEVFTAGGGAASADDGEGTKASHVARFRGLEDAERLRDRIRARLVAHKGPGLGDEDEQEDDEPEASPSGAGDLAAAARELLAETRSLRRALTADRPRSAARADARSESPRPRDRRVR